jgi:hypothetical protein
MYQYSATARRMGRRTLYVQRNTTGPTRQKKPPRVGANRGTFETIYVSNSRIHELECKMPGILANQHGFGSH